MTAVSVDYQRRSAGCPFTEGFGNRSIHSAFVSVDQMKAKDPPGSLDESALQLESLSQTPSHSKGIRTSAPSCKQPALSPHRSKSLRNILFHLGESDSEGSNRLDAEKQIEKPRISTKPLRSILHHSSRLGKSCSDLSCEIGQMSSGKGARRRRGSTRHRLFDESISDAAPCKAANCFGSLPVLSLTSETIIKETKDDSRDCERHSKVGQLDVHRSTESQASKEQLVIPLKQSARDTKRRFSASPANRKTLQNEPLEQPEHELLIPDCPFDEDFRKLEKKNSERSLGITQEVLMHEDVADCHAVASSPPSAHPLEGSNMDLSELTDDLNLSEFDCDDMIHNSNSSMLQLNIDDPASVDVLSVTDSRKKKVEDNDDEEPTYRFEDYELYGDAGTAKTADDDDTDSEDNTSTHSSTSSDEVSLTPSLADLLCVEALEPLSSVLPTPLQAYEIGSIPTNELVIFSKHVCYIVD